MKREISREEAGQALEKAVADFPWIEEFLGDNKEGFLNMYRTLHAQLRKGDKLIIKIHKSRIDGEHKIVYYEPIFKIVLYRSDGTEEPIHRVSPDGTTSSREPVGLLYD